MIVHEKIIAKLKAKIASEKKEDEADLQKQLTRLEAKYNNLKRKLQGYHDDGSDKWLSFESEFNHDMDDVGKAFADFSKKAAIRKP